MVQRPAGLVTLIDGFHLPAVQLLFKCSYWASVWRSAFSLPCTHAHHPNAQKKHAVSTSKTQQTTVQRELISCLIINVICPKNGPNQSFCARILELI